MNYWKMYNFEVVSNYKFYCLVYVGNLFRNGTLDSNLDLRYSSVQFCTSHSGQKCFLKSYFIFPRHYSSEIFTHTNFGFQENFPTGSKRAKPLKAL